MMVDSGKETLLNLLQEHQMTYEADIHSLKSSNTDAQDKLSLYDVYNRDLIDQNKFLISTCFELQEKCNSLHKNAISEERKSETLEEHVNMLMQETQTRGNKILVMENEYAALRDMYENKIDEIAQLREEVHEKAQEDKERGPLNFSKYPQPMNDEWFLRIDELEETEDKTENIERWLEHSMQAEKGQGRPTRDLRNMCDGNNLVDPQSVSVDRSKIRDQCDELRVQLSRQIEENALTQSTLESKENLLQSLNDEISGLQEHCDSLNDQIAYLQQSETSLFRENASLRNQMTNKSAKMQDLVSLKEIAERDDVIQQLVDELDRTRDVVKQMRGLIVKREEEVTSLKASKEDIQAQCNKRVQLYEVNIPIKMAKEKEKSVEEACRPLRTDNSVLRETIYKLMTENKKLYHQNDVISDDIESWRARSKGQQSKLEEMVENFSLTNFDLKVANEKISNMTVEIGLHVGQIDALTHDLKESRSKNTAFSLDSERKDHRIAQIVQELGQFKEENASNFEQIALLSSQVENLTHLNDRQRESEVFEKNQKNLLITSLEANLTETQHFLEDERQRTEKYESLLQDMDRQLQQSKREAENRLDEITHLNTNLKNYEAQRRQNEDEREELCSKIDQMASELKNIGSDRSGLLENIDQYINQITSLEQTVSSQSKDIRQLANEKSNLMNEFANLEDLAENHILEIKANEAAIDSLEQKLQLARQEISALTTKKLELQEERGSCSKRCAQLEETAEKALQQLKESNEKALSLIRDFQDYKLAHVHSNESYEQVMNELRGQRQELSEFGQRNGGLECDISGLNRHISALKEESARQIKEISLSERKMANLKENVERIAQKNSKKTKKMENLIKELTQAQTEQISQISQLQSEIEKKEALILQLQDVDKSNSAHIHDKQSQVEVLSFDVEIRRSAEARLRDEVEQKSEEISRLQNELFDSEETFKCVKTANKSLKEQLGQSKDQIKLISRQCEATANQLQSSVADCVKAQHIISRHLNELYSCREEVELSREEASGLRQFNEEFKTKVLRLQQDNYKFEKQVKALYKQLEKSEHERSRLEKIVLRAGSVRGKIEESAQKYIGRPVAEIEQISGLMAPEREKRIDLENYKIDVGDMMPLSKEETLVMSSDIWLDFTRLLERKNNVPKK